jgi:hypothetical protein
LGLVADAASASASGLHRHRRVGFSIKVNFPAPWVRVLCFSFLLLSGFPARLALALAPPCV